MMKSFLFLTILALVLVVGAVVIACGDDDDDDDDDNDDAGSGGGVCWYECTNVEGAVIDQTFCYGEGGSGDMATEALKTEAECEAFAQNACESSGYEFSQYLFDTACVSCDDVSCEPDWLSEY